MHRDERDCICASERRRERDRGARESAGIKSGKGASRTGSDRIVRRTRTRTRIHTRTRTRAPRRVHTEHKAEAQPAPGRAARSDSSSKNGVSFVEKSNECVRKTMCRRLCRQTTLTQRQGRRVCGVRSSRERETMSSNEVRREKGCVPLANVRKKMFPKMKKKNVSKNRSRWLRKCAGQRGVEVGCQMEKRPRASRTRSAGHLEFS